MKILHLLYILCAQAYYRWAMREIAPWHEDVPKIVHRQRQLADKRKLLLGD